MTGNLSRTNAARTHEGRPVIIRDLGGLASLSCLKSKTAATLPSGAIHIPWIKRNDRWPGNDMFGEGGHSGAGSSKRRISKPSLTGRSQPNIVHEPT